MRPSTLVGFALAGAKDTGNPNSEIISDAQSHVHVGGLTTLSAVFCMSLVERKTLKEFQDALHKLPLVARRRILKLFLLKRSKNQAHYRGVAGGLLGGSQVLGLGTVN